MLERILDTHRFARHVTTAATIAFIIALGFGGFVALDRVGPAGTFRTQNLTVDESTSMAGHVEYTASITPPAFTGTPVNDYNPTGLAGTVAILQTVNADTTITGIQAQPSGTYLYLRNVRSSNGNLKLSESDGGSVATNEFHLPGAESWILTPGSTAVLFYQTNNWQVVSISSTILPTFAINTNGQQQLFSTYFGPNSDGNNFWIGGGGIGAHGDIGNTNEGSENVAIGDVAGRDITTGFDSVYIGGAAGRGVTSGGDNTAVGRSALQGDGVNPVTGHHNTAIGVNVMGAAATTAEDCTAVGLDVLEFITTGFQDTCTGYESCALINTGFSNTIMGSHAFENATTAHDNTSVGLNSLRDCISCDHMTVLGRGAAGGITTGESDTLIGGATSFPSALTSWIIFSDGDGNIRQTNDGHAVLSIGTADGTTFQTAHLDQFSPRAPASVNHGALSATASDYAGTITGIGATSVALTFTGPAGGGFGTASVCTVTPIGATPQFVTVTNSKTAPTFSCFAATTGAAANCVDLNYTCVGIQ